MSEDFRDTCYGCFRPRAHCLCATVPVVDNRTGIFIIQHPREHRHPFGTARFARLGLRRHEVVVAPPRRGPAPGLAARLPAAAALLYPSTDARDLETLPAGERPSALVLLDGTWSHVKRLYDANPWLRALPHLRLNPTEPGRYRIRREPNDTALSTIEAAVAALRLIEPETPGLGALLAAFDAMVERQIAFLDAGGRPRARHRPEHVPSIPPALHPGGPPLVAVYVEHLAGDRGREPILWTAHRLDSGETFAQTARPPTAVPTDRQLAHAGLQREEVDAGLSPDALRDAWARFLRPGDVVVAWNQSTLDLAAPSRGGIHLKTIYCNLFGGACGHLGEVLALRGLTPAPVAVPGRAADRLGGALTVVALLRERARAAGAGSRR